LTDLGTEMESSLSRFQLEATSEKPAVGAARTVGIEVLPTNVDQVVIRLLGRDGPGEEGNGDRRC
jgi:hypothetical protein